MNYGGQSFSGLWALSLAFVGNTLGVRTLYQWASNIRSLGAKGGFHLIGGYSESIVGLQRAVEWNWRKT